MANDKDISGQVASGIVQGCFSIVGIILFGPAILVAVLAFFMNYGDVLRNMILVSVGLLFGGCLLYILFNNLAPKKERRNNLLAGAKPITVTAPASTELEGLAKAYGITADGEFYAFENYRYSKLEDAVNYARLKLGDRKPVSKPAPKEAAPTPFTKTVDVPDINLWEQVENSDSLYCYQCTSKLGMKAWSNMGKCYCDPCHRRFAGA